MNQNQPDMGHAGKGLSAVATLALPGILLLALLAGGNPKIVPPPADHAESAGRTISDQANKDMETLARIKLSLPRHSLSLPAAFWNEHLTNWLDVALCGRPSNFLHETVLSIVATRTMMRRNLKKIGLHSAMDWAPSLADFTINRGDPVLILARFKLHGKLQTWPLEELISLRGWHVAIGPFGWLYLGNPSPFPVSPSARAAHAGQTVATDTVLMDDPQIAMQFRGLRHTSQSLLNFPLSADNWIYPNIRYHRDVNRVPWAVFNSNGRIPVTMEFKRVSERDYLKDAALHWKNRAFAAYILKFIPLAVRIDRARASLWKAWHQDHKPWRTSQTIALDQAELGRCYTALDAAWIDWDVRHAHFSAGSGKSAVQVRQQAMLFMAHMDQKRSQYRQLWIAAKTHAAIAAIKKAAHGMLSAGDRRKIRSLKASELAAQSHALIDGNLQHLTFWQAKQNHVKPTDPRKNWLQDIAANLALAKARQSLGHKGIQYAAALRRGNGTATIALQKQYIAAILTVSLRQSQAALVMLEFRIADDKGYVSAAHMNRLLKEKKRIIAEIHKIRGQIELLKHT